jgi:hypothetical protein
MQNKTIARRHQIQLVLFAVASLAYFPFSQWISTTRFGTTLFLWGQPIYLLPLLASILGLPAMIVCLFFRRTRRPSLFLLMLTVLFIPCCIGGILLGKNVRSAAMQRLAQRSTPLIDAIHQFELDNSVPPVELRDLVPDYLPAIPSTGMMAQGNSVFEFVTLGRTRQSARHSRAGGNPGREGMRFSLGSRLRGNDATRARAYKNKS